MNPYGLKNGYETARLAAGPTQTSWRSLTGEERNTYIERYSPLIRYVADRLASRLPSHVSKDDLISSGILGLIDAVDKFDPSRNILFKTYAEFRIKGAMLDELRSLDWVPRSIRKKSSQVEKVYQTLETELGRPATDEEAADLMGMAVDDFQRLLDEIKCVSLVDLETIRQPIQAQNQQDLFEILADENATDALAALGLSEARNVIAEAIESLPQKERLVVSMYYYDELTMKEIGQVLGYTESRISQLHTKAILRLKAKLRRYFDLTEG
ncbi:MAG: FliA/WhiG family RNA polymerase sigma factor [Thermodesulfobacteriota bacterium]